MLCGYWKPDLHHNTAHTSSWWISADLWEIHGVVLWRRSRTHRSRSQFVTHTWYNSHSWNTDQLFLSSHSLPRSGTSSTSEAFLHTYSQITYSFIHTLSWIQSWNFQRNYINVEKSLSCLTICPHPFWQVLGSDSRQAWWPSQCSNEHWAEGWDSQWTPVDDEWVEWAEGLEFRRQQCKALADRPRAHPVGPFHRFS